MSLLWLRCVKFTLWICYSYVELYTIIGYSLFPPNHNFAEKTFHWKSISEYWNLPECHKICFCCQTLPEISLLGSNGIHWSFKITFPTNLCFEKHTYTHPSGKPFFLFFFPNGKIWSCVGWLRKSRLQLYLIHLFKTSIIESRPYRWPGEWGCSRQSFWVTEDLGSLGRANGDQGGPG